MKRRDFLKQSAFTAAAVTLSSWKATAFSSVKLERKGAAQKVIIVGAGLAGLSAALELTQAGHDVVILEARGRPGGRVYTLREPFSDGLYTEAGAANVFDNHHWTMKYIKQFDLTLDPVMPSTLASLLYIRGHRIEVKPGQAVEYPLDLTPEEKGLGRRGMWEKYVGPILKEIGDYTAADWPPDALKKYDQMTFFEFLRKQGASMDAASLLGLGGIGGLGDGVQSVSALVLLREAANRAMVKQNYSIRGGSDLLPKAFAMKLSDRIRYGAPVVRIEHDARQVRVVYLQAGLRTSLAADRLICAVPFSVLRHIEISPRFSAEKQNVIEQLPYTSVARTYLQTRKKFWLDEGLSSQATTDLSNMMVFDGAPNQSGTRGILESYLAGPQARALTMMKETERVGSILGEVEKVHPLVRQYFEVGTSKCWDEDEWARGAYAWFKPGQMISLLPYVARPEGRVHFAGEHASSLFGWMQGAFESGNRAAQEVNDAS
ncbi:MAG: monoamine oxidase [Acidobacteriota bacterium]|jgi:monoamine oxidase|nr:monoamine oxidase [Acidobacteriota bacterium]